MGVRNYLIFIFFLTLVCSCSEEKPPPTSSNLIQAVDISFLPMIESKGLTFFDKNAQAGNALSILKESGINTIRLRLWNNPANDHSSLKEVKEFADRIKTEGLKLWLSVHYSDKWADPGNQVLPVPWKDIPYAELLDSVYQMTSDITSILEPDYIQIGNEINNGFLHPHGNLWSNESQFLELLSYSSKAIRDTDAMAKIMIHYAGYSGSVGFFERLKELDYDAIGLSYYPKWHGKDMDELEETMKTLGDTYNKEILIAETAYPFTLGWNDWTTNIVGSEDQLILPEFPASTEGQRAFLQNIKDRLITIDAAGFAYWGATYVAFDGNDSTNGSPWENQALFGFNNSALKALNVFSD